MEGNAPSDSNHTFKVPAVAYPDIESGSIALDPDSRKDLIRMIAEARKTSRGSEPVVYFTTPEHSQDTYVGVFDSDTNMVGKPLKIWNSTIRGAIHNKGLQQTRRCLVGMWFRREMTR